MILKILVVLAIIVIAFLIVAAVQPADFRVERHTMVTAPPDLPFNQVNDLHKWQEMSPYVKLDPTAKTVFEGPSSGAGASMAWSGNSKIGEGRLKITESRPYELVRMKLDFVRPFKGTNIVEFTFRQDGDRVAVSWVMSGQKNLVTKAMGLVMNMDKMIGGEFEAGLTNLKTLVEAAAAKH